MENYPDQSNTRVGHFPILAGEDLTDRASRLALIDDDDGVAVAKLPAAVTDVTPYLTLDSVASGELVPLEPLSPHRNYRARLKGACDAGVELVMADPTTAADRGKVRVVPEAAGTYLLAGISEEAGVDGQLVLFRPVRLGTSVTVTGD